MSDDLGSNSTMTQIAMGNVGSGSGIYGGSGDGSSAFDGMRVNPPIDLSQVSISGFEAEGGGMDSMFSFGNAFSWIKSKGKSISPFGIGHNLFEIQNLGVGSLDLSSATSLKSNLNAKVSTIFSKSNDQGR